MNIQLYFLHSYLLAQSNIVSKGDFPVQTAQRPLESICPRFFVLNKFVRDNHHMHLPVNKWLMIRINANLSFEFNLCNVSNNIYSQCKFNIHSNIHITHTLTTLNLLISINFYDIVKKESLNIEITILDNLLCPACPHKMKIKTRLRRR